MALDAGGRLADRDGPDALPRPIHGLCQHPGRLRHGVRLLCHRPGRIQPQPDVWRDPGAGRAGRGAPRPRRGDGCHGWCSWGWVSPWPTTTTPSPPSTGCTTTSACPPVTSPSRRWGSCPASDAWPRNRSRSIWPCRCTRAMTVFAMSWYR